MPERKLFADEPTHHVSYARTSLAGFDGEEGTLQRVPNLFHLMGRHRGRPIPSSAASSPPATTADRLDTKGAHRFTGWVSGSSTFINNWAAAVVAQVAQVAAQGSTEFVVLAMAVESAAVVMIMVFMALTRRNVAAPWTRATATWLAAAGMLAPAVAPNRITLLLGFIALAWMGYSVYNLRSVISDAPGDRATDGQHRVQTWVYRVLLGFQLAYVGIASITGSWRYANVAVAAVLAAEGVYLLIGRDMRRAEARRIHQPAADVALLRLIRYRPVFWAVLSVTASYVVSGLFFASAQTQLTTLGWRSGMASWIVVAVAAARAMTFRRRARGVRADETAELEAHPGRALVRSGAIMALSVASLAVTLLPVGAITATVALVAAGVLFQVAMNRSNPVVREYVAQRSVDASNWLNLGGLLGVAVGGVLPAFMSWPWLVTSCALSAVVMLWIARATMGHVYESDQWRPRVPETTVYEVVGEVGHRRRRLLFRFVIRPGGRAPLPPDFEPVAAAEAGLGVHVRHKAPINREMDEEYWPSAPFFKVLWRPLGFDVWMRHRMRRTRGRAHITIPAIDPELELTAEPDHCLSQDPAGSWFVDLRFVMPIDGLLACGLGAAPYLADDKVRAVSTYDGVQRWELYAALALPEAVHTGQPLTENERLAPLTADGRAQVHHEPAGSGRPARWIVPASALDLPRRVFTRVSGQFPAGTLTLNPFHY